MNPESIKQWCAEQQFTLLLVGAVEDDNGFEASIFGQLPWRTERASSCQEALGLICGGFPGVVVCERDLPDGDWKDILEVTMEQKDPPVVIVTSRLADEYLWSEVLNLGGYDVLAKPLDRTEVHRTVNLAWQHWANRRETAVRINPTRQESEDHYVYQLG